jgi:Flp pilus assembly protein TadG
MRRLISDESGATAVIVAILLTVLVGITAFVVDIGDVLWERRMLQNSADAAALAVAVDCAQGDCLDYETTAADYAEDNNWRGANVVSVVGPDGVSPPTPAGGEVTVTTQTGTRDDAGQLRQWFAGVLGRDEGLATTAAATAVWGASKIVDAELPLVVSICDWEKYTGISWPPEQGDLDDLPTVDQLKAERPGIYYGVTLTPPDGEGGLLPPITIHESNPDEADSCTTPPGFATKDGAKFPAGFGWIDPDKGTCEYEVRSDEAGGQFADAKGGLGLVGKNCLPPSLGQAVVIPIFVAFYGNVGNGEYQIATPAAFYLTGYANIPGLADTPGAKDACKKNGGYFDEKATCITGHFVQKLEAGGIVVPDPNAGVQTIRMKS